MLLTFDSRIHSTQLNDRNNIYRPVMLCILWWFWRTERRWPHVSYTQELYELSCVRLLFFSQILFSSASWSPHFVHRLNDKRSKNICGELKANLWLCLHIILSLALISENLFLINYSYSCSCAVLLLLAVSIMSSIFFGYIDIYCRNQLKLCFGCQNLKKSLLTISC